MIVIAQLEDIHQTALRAEPAQLLKDPGPVLFQALLDLAGIHLGQILIAAVGQELGRVLKGGGVQHPLRLFPAEQLGLSGAKHG